MIKSKYITALIAVLVILAMILAAILMISPQTIGITDAARSMPYEEKLFSGDSVLEIDLAISQENWEELLDNPTAEEYYSCDVTINGETFQNVGMRTKGNTSLSQVASSDSDRYSFKLEFDHYVSSQTCYGLDKLALNNTYADPTYLKEYLSYDMYRFLGVPSSLTAFAHITINGEEWGLYLAVECLEESYAERNFGMHYGQLYQPESGMDGGNQKNQDNLPDAGNFEGMENFQNRGNFPGGRVLDGEIQPPDGGVMPEFGAETSSDTVDTTDDAAASDQETAVDTDIPLERRQGMMGGFGSSNTGSDLVYIDDDPDSYSGIFDHAVFSATSADQERVIEALQHLNDGTDLEQYINIDEVLRYFAVNTFLVNLDSYASNMKHNYYLYEEDGQLSILPWDLNLAFGTFQSGASDAVNFAIDTPVSGTTLADSPLIGKLLEIEEYRDRYHVYLQQLVDEYMESGRCLAVIEAADELIAEAVAADATAFYSAEEYQAGVKALKTFCLLRAQSISGQLDGSIPSTSEGQAADSSTLIDIGDFQMSALGTMNMGGGRGEMQTSEQNRGDIPPDGVSENGQGIGKSEERSPLPPAAPTEMAPFDSNTAFSESSPDLPTGSADSESDSSEAALPADDGMAANDSAETKSDTSSGSEKSNPFDQMPDMKLMRQAMEIIGNTDLANLSEEQKSKLNALGVTEEMLTEYESVIDQAAGGFGDNGNAADAAQPADDLSAVFWTASAACVLLLALLAAWKYPKCG